MFAGNVNASKGLTNEYMGTFANVEIRAAHELSMAFTAVGLIRAFVNAGHVNANPNTSVQIVVVIDSMILVRDRKRIKNSVQAMVSVNAVNVDAAHPTLANFARSASLVTRYASS